MENKVILKDFRQTRIISLPDYEGSQIEIYPSLLVRDIENYQNLEDQVAVGLQTLPKLIKSWNFTNEQGEDLPITADTIRNLTANSLAYLMDEITKFMTDQKKS